MTLPEGWRTASLAEVSEGGLFSDGDWVESKDQDRGGSVRLTQLADVGVGEWRNRSDRWLREDQAARLGCTFLRPGDVLIARMPDPLGRACLVPDGIGRAVTVVDVAILRVVRSDIEPRFVMWALNSPGVRARIEALQSGTTRKRISRRNLAPIKIPVPPLKEQRRLVEILEEQLSRLDVALESLQRAGEKSTAVTQQIIRGLLTGRVGDASSGSVDGPASALPPGWQLARLGDVAAVVGGVTKDAKKQMDPEYVEVPYLRVANVQRGRLDLRDITSIRVPARKAKELQLLDGDVLMNEGGDRNKLARGWVWRNQIPGCIHQNHVFRARPRTDLVEPEWLSRVANVLGGPWAERHGKQSVNLASISLSTIRQMPIPLPPLEVQRELLTRLRSQEEGDARVNKAIDASRSRGRVLRRALLDAAFTGRLTGHASDIDRAEELAFA